MASRKLKQYFQGHPITVVSSAPLGDIIQNREATGRVAKWAIELGPHGLKYVLEQPSNPKHLWILSMIGLSCKHQRTNRIIRSGLFILMDPGSWKDRGLELSLLPLEVIKFAMSSA